MNKLKYLAEPYLTYIKVGAILAVLAIVGWQGMKYGSQKVQGKWDQEKIVVQAEKIKVQEKVIDLQNQLAERDRKQAEIDKAAAEAAAAERARLEQQARDLKSSLDKLTRDLQKSPQYKACVLDDDAFDQLNRSLR